MSTVDSSKRNELLYRVACIFQNTPEVYDQAFYWLEKLIAGECGTVGCIAGHITNEAVKIGLLKKQWHLSAAKNAQQLLGLNNTCAGELFSIGFKPKENIAAFLLMFRAFLDQNPTDEEIYSYLKEAQSYEHDLA